MPSKEEVNDFRDFNKEVEIAAKRMFDLKQAQQDVLFFARDYADEAKKAAKEVYGSSVAASGTAKAFKDVASAAKEISDNYGDVLTGQKTFNDLTKAGLKLDAAKNSLATEYGQALAQMNVSAADQEKILNGTLDVYDAVIASNDDLTDSQVDLIELYVAQNKLLDEEADNMAEIAKRAGTIDDAMRPLGKHAISLQDMGDGLEKGLGKAGLGDLAGKLGIGDAISGARETAAQLTEGGTKALGMSGKLKIAGDMAKTMGGNLMKALGPAALIAMAIEQIVAAFKMIDGAAGEMAKEMGVSAAEGQKMVFAAKDAATASGDMLVSTKDVVAAQRELNSEFGTSVKFSGEFAAEFASIKERTGLSGEAMGLFAEKALLAGTSIKDQLKKVTEVTMEMSAQSGVMLNAKDIQEGIGKISKANMLTAGMNTKEMTKQVVQAKLLGVSQSQLASIGDSLLDFEGSIAAEMEAELLTGKQLNLENARAAALAGDQAALAVEIRKEVGTAAEFGAMNVIQQEAMAKAFGMSREDMAGMLVEQQKLEALKAQGFESASDAQEQYNQALKDGTLTEELKANLAEAGLLAQMESATEMEKMTAITEKLQDLFISLMEPLMPILSMLTDIVMQALEPMMPILNDIFKVFGFINSILISALGPILETLFLPLELVMDLLKDIGDEFAPLLGDGEEMGDIFKDIGKVIGKLVSVGLLPMQMVIRTVVEAVRGLMDVFGGVFKLFQGDFMGGFAQIGDGIAQMLMSPFKAAEDIAMKMINNIIEALNYIPGVDIDQMESSNMEINKPEIEPVGLASGGIVTSPTNALIGEGGEPEAVIPLSKLSTMVGGNNSTQSNTNKNIETLLTKLLAAVEKGGDVYMDGNKVGRSLALATSNMG
tara:strand:- start:7208 stop:9859 length:2652 start_codon:yes stop_codon:yes gene_type:complete